jgi:hypothetical protein
VVAARLFAITVSVLGLGGALAFFLAFFHFLAWLGSVFRLAVLLLQGGGYRMGVCGA